MLRGVIDPELGSDIVDLGMAKGATVDPDDTVHLRIALTTAGCPLRAQIQRDVRDLSRIHSLDAHEVVELVMQTVSELLGPSNWSLLLHDEPTDKLYFEIPRSQLGKDMLLIGRMASAGGTRTAVFEVGG